MEIFLALAGGLTLGAIHAFDVDHITAVTAFASKDPDARTAMKSGILWGVGHSTTLIVLGTLSLAFKFVIPPIVLSYAEMSVGLLLIVIGFWVLRDVFRRGNVHVHRHEHDGMEHVHFHSHKHGEQHRHNHSLFFVGATHGFAGTASVMVVIPIAMTQSLTTAVLYLLLFSVGTVGAMAVFAHLLGRLMRSAPPVRAVSVVQSVAGGASICIGLLWLGGPLLQ